MQNSVEMFLSQIVKIHFALTKAFSLCWQQVIWSFTHKKFLSLIIPAVMSAVFLFRQNLQIKQTLNQDSTGGMIENVFRKKKC